ncbi:MAG: lytic transglycosylase domain-containing protein [Deltaproteobacteria bacterium]|nr:lytic transglycosylase domain-containing protein [Deltaproteobacteria bacterium]
MRAVYPSIASNRALVLFIVVFTSAAFSTSCATSRYGRTYGGTRPPTGAENPGAENSRTLPTYRAGYVKDNKPEIWVSAHSRVLHFNKYYNETITVEKALERAQPYLPTIMRIFREKRLPLELAFLPMLESVFINTANSGSAKGMWQFTRQTAEHMGLNVGAFSDERLNWRKATVAAAEYLDMLGQRFNYDWTLALAAYNGGPGHVEEAIGRARSRDFFALDVRKETYDYVPKFLAMVQVAKEKYPHLLLAGR